MILPVTTTEPLSGPPVNASVFPADTPDPFSQVPLSCIRLLLTSKQQMMLHSGPVENMALWLLAISHSRGSRVPRCFNMKHMPEEDSAQH